jgi:hypothetical protein
MPRVQRKRSRPESFSAKRFRRSSREGQGHGDLQQDLEAHPFKLKVLHEDPDQLQDDHQAEDVGDQLL